MNRSGPNEGYYWTVAQYQISLLKLGELISAAGRGESVDPDELSLKAAVLASKANVLTAASELTDYFSRKEEYVRARVQILAFQANAKDWLASPEQLRANLDSLTQAYDASLAEVVLLGSAIRSTEIESRESMLEHLARLQHYLWGAVTVVVVLFGWWARQLLASERQYRRVAAERAEALTREKAALERLDEAVNDKVAFLAMVSHELRSSLQNIVSGVEVLKRVAVQDEGAGVARNVHRAAGELTRQLGDVMTLARGEAGQLRLQSAVFDICELVAMHVDDAREQAQLKGLRVHLRMQPSHALVRSDEVRIGQVLTNLLSNAVKYTQEGEVRVQLTVDSVSGMLTLVVEDTGPGISSEFQAMMFRPFRRASRNEDGSGLGLAVVSMVLRAMGGRIEVASEEGLGARFEVTLPLHVVPLSPETGPSSMEQDALRMLVVDDREDVRLALSEAGRRLGAQVEGAESAEAARRSVDQAPPYDVVLIDLNMPDLDGGSLAVALRRGSAPSRAAMFVSISAGHEVDPAHAWAFDHHLEKPISDAALSQMFETIRRGRA